MNVAARRLAAAAAGAATAGGVSSSRSSLLRSSRGGTPLARLTLARHFAIINGASSRTGSRAALTTGRRCLPYTRTIVT